ncbi:peptide deformylase [Anaerorhabdus sp.]|uniref:peptide deformylase n=1 Tax=Anaerorhabdus sp. TaxID=1872524 RepID=UPI002FC6EBCE
MEINNNTIVKDTDPKIREKSFPVELPLKQEDRETLENMLIYVKESIIPEIAEAKNLRPAVGISAIQIGLPKQLTAISLVDYDKNDNEIHYEYALVNPKIVSYSVQSSYLENGEGCLSVEEPHQGLVPRHARIKVEAFDMLQNKNITIKAQGYFAIVLQHEIDHFSGILFYDHIDKENPFKHIEGAQVI